MHHVLSLIPSQFTIAITTKSQSVDNMKYYSHTCAHSNIAHNMSVYLHWKKFDNELCTWFCAVSYYFVNPNQSPGAFFTTFTVIV